MPGAVRLRRIHNWNDFWKARAHMSCHTASQTVSRPLTANWRTVLYAVIRCWVAFGNGPYCFGTSVSPLSGGPTFRAMVLVPAEVLASRSVTV